MRSSSACNIHKNLKPANDQYISPFIKKDVGKKSKSIKAGGFGTVSQLNRKASVTNITSHTNPFSDMISVGPNPLAQKDQFTCAMSAKQEKLSKPKDAVTAIELHRKIYNLERVITKQDEQVKDLKLKVVESKSAPGAMHCCCEELKFIFE